MKFSIFHLLLIASIYGVLGSDDEPIINGKGQSDVPSPSTVVPNTTIVPPTSPVTTPITTTTTELPTTSKTPATTHATTTTSTKKPTTPSPTPSPTTTTTHSSTEATTAAPTEAPSHKGRKFDGPSFIGGIILASGLMAICFVSWKFYKARTERNYHTL